MIRQPLVSVVIPTHNRKKKLIRLINSLLIGSYKNVELIIVDDASSDGTYESILSQYKKNNKVKIFRNRTNIQTAGSKNKGISHARGEYLYFIDDDDVATKNLIKNLVETFNKDKTIGEVGPVIYFLNDKKRIIWSKSERNMWSSRVIASNKLFNADTWNTDDVPNTFMVKSSIVKENKILFNAKLGILFEESDFAYKIRKAGYSIKVKKAAKVYHDVVLTKNDIAGLLHTFLFPKRSYYLARNRFIFQADYATRLQLFLFLFFWNFLFTLFYIYHILSYSTELKNSFFRKIELLYYYIVGLFEGYIYAIPKLLV